MRVLLMVVLLAGCAEEWTAGEDSGVGELVVLSGDAGQDVHVWPDQNVYKCAVSGSGGQYRDLSIGCCMTMCKAEEWPLDCHSYCRFIVRCPGADPANPQTCPKW